MLMPNTDAQTELYMRVQLAHLDKWAQSYHGRDRNLACTLQAQKFARDVVRDLCDGFSADDAYYHARQAAHCAALALDF
jgi:hypothetical protein